MATIHPACFESDKQFKEWKLVAIAAREHSTPCSDCTKEYRARMLRQKRCDEQHVKVMFRYPKRKPNAKDL